MFKKILVGYDGSKGGRLALERAIELGQSSGASVTALWVQAPLPRYTDLPGEPEDQTEAGDSYFAKRKQEAEVMANERGGTIVCTTLRGHPAKVLVSTAQSEGFDLIVMGHSDHSEMWGRLLGDTADRVSDHSHCSILIVKG